MRDFILCEIETVLLLVFLTNKALHLGPDEILDQVGHLEALSLQQDVTDYVQAGPENFPDVVKLEVDVSVSQRKTYFPLIMLLLLFCFKLVTHLI